MPPKNEIAIKDRGFSGRNGSNEYDNDFEDDISDEIRNSVSRNN
jgi:hypothetical protein